MENKHELVIGANMFVYFLEYLNWLPELCQVPMQLLLGQLLVKCATNNIGLQGHILKENGWNFTNVLTDYRNVYRTLRLFRPCL